MSKTLLDDQQTVKGRFALQYVGYADWSYRYPSYFKGVYAKPQKFTIDEFCTAAIDDTMEDYHIHLRPANSLTEDEKIALAKVLDYTGSMDTTNEDDRFILLYYVDEFLKNVYCSNFSRCLLAKEFLISLAVAIDWNGITVAQQLERGWIRLIDTKKLRSSVQ